MSLYVTTRSEDLGSKMAYRLELSARGAVGNDGAIGLDVERVTCESRDSSGVVVRSEVPASPGDAHSLVPAALGALRETRLRLELDPSTGIVAVAGIDAALARASALQLKDGAGWILGLYWSDAAWARDLANAGMSAIPPSLREGAPAERTARVWVPGRGETATRLVGEAGRDDGGSSAVQVIGRLAEGAVFTGASDPTLGEPRLAEVECRATTSYGSEPALPRRGEWAVTVPFDGGPTIRTTTSFTLVLR